MRKVNILLVAAITGAASASTLAAGPHLMITGAKVLDVQTGAIRPNMDILIEGDRFRQIAEAGRIDCPPETTRLDLSGLVLLPGLIDLHTHLLLHPYDETPWNDQVLKESLELRTIRATVAARATLENGFTTIRDLGTEGAAFADVAVRDAVNAGMITGPRIIAVTRAIVATGCYGPSGFDPRWTLPVGAQVADGPAGVRKAVREQIAAGADWIKVYADYRRKPEDPSTATFSQEELNAIVDEARSAGLPVAAHAVTDEAIRRSVLAGVASIEHGSEASSEVLTLMKERDVVLCPTLAASEAMARYGGWRPGMPDHERIKSTKEMFRRALDSGITIACGSDAGVFAHGDNLREIELMVEYGMTPAQALAAATSVAAKVIGREHELGRIAEGFCADMIAVRANPLKDLSACRNPLVVIKGGQVVIDRRTKP